MVGFGASSSGAYVGSAASGAATTFSAESAITTEEKRAQIKETDKRRIVIWPRTPEVGKGRARAATPP